MVRGRTIAVVLAAGCFAAAPRVGADDATLPTFRSFAGTFLGSSDHDFFVESEVLIPVLRLEPVSTYFRYEESTPFVKDFGGAQAELLYTRYESQVDVKLADQLRLICLGSYQTAYELDQSGQLGAYAIGGGIGSPLRRDGERVSWQALAGGYLSRRDLSSDWWMDIDVSWRAIDFARGNYMNSAYRASIAFVGDVRSSNDGGIFRALYRLGPDIQFLTANGNRANIQFRWYHNDNNPFYGRDENGFLLGLEVNASFDRDYVLAARTQRQPGWFPEVWGAYDVGLGNTRRISRFEMNVEAVDFVIAEHRYTGFIWYESRQEHRDGDFDNIAYSVSLGIQTPIGLESVLSHGDPLVFGVDYLHRSDHALAPDPDRVPPPEMITNGSHNVLPRVRLQTLGWDLPYRDPHMYDRKTQWLNIVDWRVTAGLDVTDDRSRGRFAGQLGANWDVATIEGYVVYARGIGSIGNETPDWLGEFGVRRPAGKVFGRYESYGFKPDIGRGDTLTFGVGVNL